MRAYNVVRFKVKPGQDSAFLAAHREAAGMEGLVKGDLIKTGEGTYCFIGEWESFERIAAARPSMIALLDSFRGTLEDLGGGLGVTDPVSGEVVAELR